MSTYLNNDAIKDGSITNAKIADGTIEESKLEGHVLDGVVSTYRSDNLVTLVNSLCSVEDYAMNDETTEYVLASTVTDSSGILQSGYTRCNNDDFVPVMISNDGTQMARAVPSVEDYIISVVSSLPSETDSNTIYFVTE